MRRRAAPPLCGRTLVSRLLGLAAVGLLGAVPRLPALSRWRSKGLGGFMHYEAAAADRFRASPTCSSIRPTLQGPDAAQTVAGADLEGAISKAAAAAYGPAAARHVRRCRGRASSRDAIVANPDMLEGTRDLWLPVASNVDIAAKDRRRRMPASGWSTRSSQRHALRARFNAAFLTRSDATDPSAVGVWGALKGTLPHHVGDDAARLPDRRPGRGLSRGIRAAEPLDRR